MADSNRELAALKELERRIMGGDESIPPAIRQKVEGKLKAYRKQGEAKPLDGGKPLSDGAQTKLENAVQTYGNMKAAAESFNDDFGGNTFTKGMENSLQSLNSDFGTPGQRNWWSRFKSTDNIIRNDLFGATLTPGEQAAYEETTIAPNMDPKIIRENLATRTEILRKAMARKRTLLNANGAIPEAVDAAMGEYAADFMPDYKPPVVPPAKDDKAVPAIAPPIDPAGTGDIGAAGGPPSVATKLSDEDRAAFAQLVTQPDTTAEDVAAFMRDRGFKLENQADIAAAQEAGAGLNPDPIEQLPNADAQLTGPDSAVLGATDALTFGAAPKLGAVIDATGGLFRGQDFGDSYNRSLDANNGLMQASEEQHPFWTLGGNAAGLVGGGMALAKIPKVASALSALPQAGRAVAADAAYGGLYGAGSSDNLGDAALNSLSGTALSALGGVAGRGLAKGVAALGSPIGTQVAQRLNARGISLTPGQALGGVAKGVEDRLAGFPIIGDAINASRRQGVEDFNRVAINDSIAPTGVMVSNKAVGHEAIGEAQKAVSDAYDAALTPFQGISDQQLLSDISGIAGAVRADQRDAFNNVLLKKVVPHLPAAGDPMTGRQLQKIKRGLQESISQFKGDANGVDLANDLGAMRDAMLDFAQRADPVNAAGYRAADAANAGLKRVESAAAGTKDGVFTPGQYLQAIRKRGFGTTTSNLASGSALGQDFASDISVTLPSSVPDSGTAGRMALGLLAPSLVGGAGGAALGGGYSESGSGALTGAALGAGLLSGPYLPGGRQVTQKLLLGKRNKTVNTLGDWLRKNAPLVGGVTAPAALQHLPEGG